MQLHGWFESNHTVHIAMEYFPSGDLSTCFRDPVAEDLVKNIGEQLLEGLTRMHELGITHRDLKPQVKFSPIALITLWKKLTDMRQNIFVAQIDPIWVKIGDFGISKLTSNDGTALRTSRVGTQGFQAPEILQLLDNGPETSEYTRAVDIWSLGCVLYGLKCRRLPFPGSSLWGYCQGSGGFPESPLRVSGMTTAGIEFLNELLAVDPSKRPSATRALQSPWISQHGDSSEDWKEGRGQRQKSTMDSTPDAMSYGPSESQKIMSHPNTQFCSDQTAIEPPVPSNNLPWPVDTARTHKYNFSMPNRTRVSHLQSAQPGAHNERRKPQMRQQSPVNPKQSIQNGVPRLPHSEVQAQDASSHRSVTLQRDANDESRIAANRFSGSAFHGSDNRASDGWISKHPAMRRQREPENFREYAIDDSRVPANVNGKSKLDNTRRVIDGSQVLANDSGESKIGNTRRTNERILEQQRFARQQAERLRHETVADEREILKQKLESEFIEDGPWKQRFKYMIQPRLSKERVKENKQKLENERGQRVIWQRSRENAQTLSDEQAERLRQENSQDQELSVALRREKFQGNQQIERLRPEVHRNEQAESSRHQKAYNEQEVMRLELGPNENRIQTVSSQMRRDEKQEQVRSSVKMLSDESTRIFEQKPLSEEAKTVVKMLLDRLADIPGLSSDPLPQDSSDVEAMIWLLKRSNELVDIGYLEVSNEVKEKIIETLKSLGRY